VHMPMEWMNVVGFVWEKFYPDWSIAVSSILDWT
jgi:hypothetical protein